MKEIVYDDFDKVCRGCLAKNGEMRPLFGSFLDNMLRAVAEIEVIVIDCSNHFRTGVTLFHFLSLGSRQ